MDGALVVLRPDLVVYVAATSIPPDAARQFADAWREAVSDTVQLVVIPAPVEVLDLRGADPDLIALAERLTAQIEAVLA